MGIRFLDATRSLFTTRRWENYLALESAELLASHLTA